MDQKKYIGLDVHQASIPVAVRDAAGKLVSDSIIETKATSILEFVRGMRLHRLTRWFPRNARAVPGARG